MGLPLVWLVLSVARAVENPATGDTAVSGDTGADDTGVVNVATGDTGDGAEESSTDATTIPPNTDSTASSDATETSDTGVEATVDTDAGLEGDTGVVIDPSGVVTASALAGETGGVRCTHVRSTSEMSFVRSLLGGLLLLPWLRIRRMS